MISTELKATHASYNTHNYNVLHLYILCELRYVVAQQIILHATTKSHSVFKLYVGSVDSSQLSTLSLSVFFERLGFGYNYRRQDLLYTQYTFVAGSDLYVPKVFGGVIVEVHLIGGVPRQFTCDCYRHRSWRCY